MLFPHLDSKPAAHACSVWIPSQLHSQLHSQQRNRKQWTGSSFDFLLQAGFLTILARRLFASFSTFVHLGGPVWAPS